MYGCSFLPDEAYVRLFYWSVTGRRLNLKNPVGYNEKLQYIKLYDKHPEYNRLVDKLAVREHIEKVLGPEYSIPLLGAWKSFNEIDFEKLPNEFVLKCNHDSGSSRVIKDKSALTKADLDEMRRFYNRRLAHDFFDASRDVGYKNIPPRIMAEKLMHSAEDGEGGIKDYKFFCFNGEPKLLLVVSGRMSEKHEDYFDMDLNWLHIQNGWTESPQEPQKPAHFEEMREIAAKLSMGMRQVRLDLYLIDGHPYFGEYTTFNGGGFELFKPDEWERKMGDWLDISDIQEKRKGKH